MIMQKGPQDNGDTEKFKWITLSRSEYIEFLAKDTNVKKYLEGHPPLCYLKHEKKLGFIDFRKCELLNPIVIEAMGEPRDTILVPSSSRFECFTKTDRGEIIERQRQCFNLCFFIAPDSNSKYPKQRRYKNRGMLQVFEV